MSTNFFRENLFNANVQLCFLLSLFFCGGLISCSTAPHTTPTKLDIANHQIEQVRISFTNEPGEPSWQEYQNFLLFPDANIRVPLVRSDMTSNESVAGFDPESLKLQWLKRDELLWISWTTVYQGSGGYTHDGNVILQLSNGQNRELFRDYFESVARGGWAAQYYANLKIAYNDRDKTFRFTRSKTEINGDLGAPDPKNPLPFTITFTNDDGKIGYLSTVHTIDTWTYRLSGNKLKFLDGNSAVDVGDEAEPIAEITNDFNVTRAELQRMNPRVAHQQNASGSLTLKKSIPPYTSSTDDDGLNGDK